MMEGSQLPQDVITSYMAPHLIPIPEEMSWHSQSVKQMPGIPSQVVKPTQQPVPSAQMSSNMPEMVPSIQEQRINPLTPQGMQAVD